MYVVSVTKNINQVSYRCYASNYVLPSLNLCLYIFLKISLQNNDTTVIANSNIRHLFSSTYCLSSDSQTSYTEFV